MSKNKSRKCQYAVTLLDQILEIENKENNSLPGTAVGLIKDAKKNLLRDIRKRRENRERELIRHGQ